MLDFQDILGEMNLLANEWYRYYYTWLNSL